MALEAWRSGAPLVMTNRGGGPGFVRDGNDGILVDPEDADALAGAPVRVSSDERAASAARRRRAGASRRVHVGARRARVRGALRRGIRPECRKCDELFRSARRRPRQLRRSRSPPRARPCGAAASSCPRSGGRPPNFGDDMTPWLLPNYGVLPIHRVASARGSPASAAFSSSCPRTGAASSGAAASCTGEPHPLKGARVLAVRGHLTRELVGAPDDVALGDPGILVGRLRPRPERGGMSRSCHTVTIGSTRRSLRSPRRGVRVRVVNVHQTAERVVREIGGERGRHHHVPARAGDRRRVRDPGGVDHARPATEWWCVQVPRLRVGDHARCDPVRAIDPGMSLSDLLVSASVAPRETVEAACDALEASAALLPEAVRASGRFPRDLPRMLADRR